MRKDAKQYLIGNEANGVELTIRKEGLEIFGWYDHFVGLCDPEIIPWDKLDNLRSELFAKRRRKS